MEKVLEGDLSRFTVPDVLTFLSMVRHTGVLVMERSDQETKLFFRQGTPVYATTSKEELRLGTMLVRQGRIGAEALDRVLARQRSSGHRIGRALLAEKVLTEAELESFLKVQVSEVIFETFDWKEGAFTFWDKVPPPATAVTLEMDVQNLLMEGARRSDERGRLPELFPDLDVVVESVANPERIKQSVTFTPEEWKVFFLVDGRRTLREICQLMGGSEDTATLQILVNLVTANFIQLSARAPVPAPPEEDEPPAQPTQKWLPEKSDPPSPPPPPVAFAAPPAPRPPEDDTKEVVNPKAVGYLGNAQRITVARLALVQAEGEASFPLGKDSLTVGRHRNNDIVISDPKVSAFHARIDRSPEGFVLVDLNSRNGSYLNGKRVESALLHTGDEVRMGTARLVYRVDYVAQG